MVNFIGGHSSEKEEKQLYNVLPSVIQAEEWDGVLESEWEQHLAVHPQSF